MDRRTGGVVSTRGWSAAYVVAVALGLVLLGLLTPRAGAPEAPAACREGTPDPAAPLRCLGGLPVSILTVELGGTRERWACQLGREAGHRPSRLAATECAELRALRLRDELRHFDSGFFIPLYASLSLLLVGWLVAPTADGAASRRLQVLAIALALATAVLAALDQRENRAALAVLDRMDAAGVAPPDAPGDDIDTLAAQARQRSLLKWAAGVPWAALLGLGLGAALRRGRSQVRTRAWSLTAHGIAAAGMLGAALLCAGVASAGFGDGLARPVRLIGLGMIVTMAAAVCGALAAAVALWRQRPGPGP